MEYGISPSRIGIIGFSAGAAVSEATAIYYTPETRPDFVAAFYGALPSAFDGLVPADAPPMFLAAASDDQFGSHTNTVALYSKWIAAKRPAELHVYAKGGHAFGMRKQNLPVELAVYDMQGFRIHQQMLKESKAAVNLLGKKPGLYVLQVKNGAKEIRELIQIK